MAFIKLGMSVISPVFVMKCEDMLLLYECRYLNVETFDCSSDVENFEYRKALGEGEVIQSFQLYLSCIFLF